MREPDRLSHSHRSSRSWAAVAVALLLVGTVCLTVGLRGNHDALAGPPSDGATGSRIGHPIPGGLHPAHLPSDPHGPETAYSVPVQLRIPALHMVVPLSQLGLQPDRTVEVPSNPDEPGWFKLGPTPGQIGSAVILGHVDSYAGPAVFVMLRFLQPGDTIRVHLADGVVAHFVVSAVVTYPNAQFPARKVYGSHGYSALALVTCGGDFDTATQKYQANVVVFSRLVRTTSVEG
jgi:hypothetical protein